MSFRVTRYTRTLLIGGSPDHFYNSGTSPGCQVSHLRISGSIPPFGLNCIRLLGRVSPPLEYAVACHASRLQPLPIALIGDLLSNSRFRSCFQGSLSCFRAAFGFTTIASRRMATVQWCLRGGGCQPFLHGLHCAPGIKFGVAAFFVHLLWHQDKR